MKVAGFIRSHVVRCAVAAFVLGSTVVGLPAPAAHAATPTFVQARANEVNGGTTNSLAFTNPNTAGNLIVVYAVWSNGGTVSINDNRGNTYSSALPATRWNGNTWSAQVFYATNVASGANSVTATFGTAINSFGIIYIHEYSGIDKVNPLDVSKSAIGTSSAMNSGSATTTNANDLIFGAGASKSNVNQAGSGFTTRLTNYGNRTEDKRVTATGSYNATATQNSNAWVMQMVAFKADTGVTDTTAPTVPTNLAATPASISQINLSWSASTDNVGVAGYRIFRNGVQVGTSTTTSFNDTGLTANTTYGYSVNAYDAAGNTSAQTAAINATTLADTSSPTVPTGLTATAVSSTQVNLTWAASTDNVGVTGYDVFRDGVQLTTVGSTSYINTGLTAGTTYSYTVRARDAAGNLSAQTSAVNVVTPPVDTVPPSVSMTAPASGSTVSGSITVSANATDNVAVTGVQFLLDGASLGAEDTAAPYSIAWNTATAPNGLHTLTARARDAAGNSTTTSGAVTVTVSNTATSPAGLAAGYPFDEGTGTTAADASGHTLTGTLINGAGWASGKYGTAVNLDGANDYVDLGNPAGLQITGSMTISAWVNSAVFPFDDAAIVSKRGTAGFQLDTTVDKGPRTIGFKLTTGTGADMFRYGATALQTNTWYHIAGVYDATARTLDVYLNGVLDNGVLQGAVGTSQQSSPQNVNIGQRPGQSGFNLNGRIDDVRIYNRALTATEIVSDMNAPLGSAPSADPTPPTVVVSSPAAGAQVSDIVNITANADDNVGVVGVQFYVDGVANGSEDAVAPYALAWDTRTASNGSHSLTARARDAAGNSTLSSAITVNVANSNFFQNEILATGFNLPTAIKFLPDGRMLVVELAGVIRVLPPPYLTPSPTPFLQLTNVGSAGVQQGIYEVQLDPNFAVNHYYYIFYTLGTPNRDRLSRFTANSTLTGTVAGSELVLYQDPQDANAEHHGGAITFGNDGKLYFTTGEHFTAGDSQILSSPRGKIHRINPDGTVPTDNPFYDGAGSNWDSIWALGVRNPFRAYFDAPTNRLFFGDVGGNDYSTAKEEVNVGARGANYGWPNFEGSCSGQCTSPLYFWPHNGRDSAVVGGFVYHGTQFPSSYQGSYFFADYTQNWIRRLTLDANGNLTGVYNFEPADGSVDGPYGDIVYLIEGPDGALYYVDLGYSDIGGTYGISKIRRIKYVQSNQAPVVSASADVTSGPPPLTVNFSSSGSSDPEGQPLTYSWTFGDGATSTQANPSHIYNASGQYTARLTVSDGVNSSNSLPITISVGTKPVASILSPTDGSFFVANDTITYSGNATDNEDGVLPASAYTWNIDFLHEGHVHPGIAITGVKNGTFTIPTSGHDFSGNTRYRITLTVTDSNGLTDTKTVFIWPTKVNLTFDSAPSGATLYLDGIAKLTPFVYDTLVGFSHTIEARNQTVGTNSYTFASWSDGGAQTHTVLVPSTAQSYTATYTVTPVASGPIAFVQLQSATPQTPQASVSVAFSTAETAGNLNAVVIGWDNATSNIVSVTDNAGNTYSPAAPTTRSSVNSQAIYYAKNIVGGPTTVTVTFNTSTPYVDIRIAEYSGLSRTNPLDVAASATGSASVANSGSVTTTSASELLLGAGTTTGAFTSAGSGYTLRVITQPDADICEDRIVTATGSYNATASVSGTWVMQLVTFRQ